HRLDASDRAALELAGPELRFHLAADPLPSRSSDPGINAAVGDDLDVAVREQEIDQDPVIVRGVPDPQMRKDVERTLARRLVAEQGRAVERPFHHKTDLTRMRGFALPDHVLDPVEHVRRKYLLHPPGMLHQMFGNALDAHGLPAP